MLKTILAPYVSEELIQNSELSDKALPLIERLVSHIQNRDIMWHNEIAKYLPQLHVMSFRGPEPALRWLMDRVEIKSEYVNCISCQNLFLD